MQFLRLTLVLSDLEDFHFTSSSYNSAKANVFLDTLSLWLFSGFFFFFCKVFTFWLNSANPVVLGSTAPKTSLTLWARCCPHHLSPPAPGALILSMFLLFSFYFLAYFVLLFSLNKFTEVFVFTIVFASHLFLLNSFFLVLIYPLLLFISE